MFPAGWQLALNQSEVPSAHKLLVTISGDKASAILQVAEGLRAQQPPVWCDILLRLEQPAPKCQKQQCLDILVSWYSAHEGLLAA